MWDRAPSDRLRVTVVAVALLFASSAAHAQSGLGSLSGRVVDAGGAPVAEAKITLVDDAFGQAVRAVVTATDGTFALERVPPGSYTVDVTKQGLATAEFAAVRIAPGAATALPDVTLGTPQAETSARVPVVTLSPARGGEFTSLQIAALPLGGTTEIRTFDEFVFLLPGVSDAPLTVGVRGPGVGFGAGQFSVNGLRARSNNFTIDGSDNNDPDVGLRRQGFVALVPQTIESIQQFQVLTLLYDAESGRNFGGQINAVSRAGTYEYHGQAYGFFTDSRLDARNSFDYTGGASRGEDPFTRGQWGGVFGGPLFGDATQFLVAFEHQDVNGAVEQHFAVPTAAERRFIGLPEVAVLRPFPGSDPTLAFSTTTGQTPLGANILSVTYPLPNNPGGPYGENTYTEELEGDGDGTVFSARVSRVLTPNHQLDVRYNFLDDDRLLPSFNKAIHSSIEAQTQTHNLSVILNSTLSQRLTNQARFSFGRKSLGFLERPSSPFLFRSSSVIGLMTENGMVSFLSDTGPIGQLLIEPFSAVGVDAYLFPQGSANNAFQGADTMALTRGAHAIKFGADIRRIQLNSFQDRLYRPLVTYGNALQSFGFLTTTGDERKPFGFRPLSPVLALPGVQLAAIGAPTSILQVLTKGTPDSHIGLRFIENNFFVHDTWSVRPGLTLDVGLRYELNTVPTEVNRRIEGALMLEDLPVPGGSAINSPLATAFFDGSVEAYRKVLGGRENIYDGDHNNFAPRIGFAWSPKADGPLVVRGGYGVYFDAVLGALVSQSRNVFPTEVPIVVSPNFLGANILTLNLPQFLAFRDSRGNVAVPVVAPGTLNQIGGSAADYVPLVGTIFAQNFNTGGLAFTLPEKDLATPYSQHWHLTVERELFGDTAVSVGYIGTKGTKLTRLTTPNLGPNSTTFLPIGVAAPGTPFPQGPPLLLNDIVQSIIQPRPDPFLGAITIYENSAASTYHSLQVEVRKRYAHGYTYTFAYTYSHAIDDVSDVLPIAGASTLAQNQFNLRLERGSASFDERHRVAASVLWDLPFFRQDEGLAAAVLGDWQIASIYRASTGQPFTLRLPFDANLDGNLTDRPYDDASIVRIEDHGRVKVALPANPVVADYVQPFQTSFLEQFGVLVASGFDGYVGRNTYRADGFANLDLAFTKRVPLGENRTLLLRTEVFNALNRANYGVPERTLFSPGFGGAIDTVNPARIVQFAVKFEF
jgi:hypothetical protein